MQDFVQYKLFDIRYLNVSSKSNQNAIEFINYGKSLINIINKLCDDYLWSKDNFYIEPKFVDHIKGARIDNRIDNNIMSHFQGTMYYGGDINDEWFIVYLLYQLTKFNEYLSIEIMDNDGQFLLIHCAFSLPEWIDPNNVKNRVYIHKNKLHLIPLVYNVINDKQKSINLVSNNSINTLANNDIQNSIYNKLNEIRDKIYLNPGINYHSSIVVLTKQCANIIHKFPSIISHIIESYINNKENNDFNFKKQIKIKERKFELDDSEYVFVSVRFTRYLYANLVSKPLKSAPMYFRKKKFDFRQYQNKNMLNIKKITLQNAFLNGIKLMIGFESFYRKCLDNIKNDNIDREWIKFKKSLIKKGYFNDCIPSTLEYKKKEQSAKQYYDQNMQNMKNTKEINTNYKDLCVNNGIHPNDLSSFCLNLMNNKYEKKYENKDWIKVYDNDNDVNTKQNFDKLKNDNDDWINIKDNELKELLNQYSYFNNDKHQQMLFQDMLDDDNDDDEDDNNKSDNNEEIKQQTNDDILSLNETLNTFINTESSFIGVENDIKHNIDDIDDIEFDPEIVINILKDETKKGLNLENNIMKDLMNKMDDELSLTKDSDLNIVNNILQSHIIDDGNNDNTLKPTTTLLSQMGLHLS